MANKTLPEDSAERKQYPLFRGCMRYFPAALASIAYISKIGNDKHNPGQDMHHARDKSSDHADCLLRHLMDLEDLRASGGSKEQILEEVSCLAWRALALSQELHESFGAPLAPGAKLLTKVEPKLDNTASSSVSYWGVDIKDRNKDAQVRITKGD